MGAERRLMKYNPDVHHRHSIRLKEYDYSKEGMYFVTICTKNRKNLFWNNNRNDKRCRGGACSAQIPELNYLGNLIQKEWIGLKKRYVNVELDEYVIMPNHLHGIIILKEMKNGRSKPRPYNRKYNLCI